jgi:hypothetical protein
MLRQAYRIGALERFLGSMAEGLLLAEEEFRQSVTDSRTFWQWLDGREDPAAGVLRANARALDSCSFGSARESGA